MSIDDDVSNYFKLRDKIFAHVGYKQDWCVWQIDDSRDQFWAINPAPNPPGDDRERGDIWFSSKRETIEYVITHGGEWGPHGSDFYSNTVYTNRFLPKWVYRGPLLTMIVADTHTDGNKYLQLFRNENEVKGSAQACLAWEPAGAVVHGTVPAIFGFGQDGEVVLTDTTPLATRDMYYKKVTGTLEQMRRHANGFRVFMHAWDEV